MMALEHLLKGLSAVKVNAGYIVSNVAMVLSRIALDAAGVDDVVRLLSADTASCCAFVALRNASSPTSLGHNDPVRGTRCMPEMLADCVAVAQFVAKVGGAVFSGT